MSEEEELKGIRKEVWWLSTFLVKLPLFIGCLWLIVLGSKECNTDEMSNEQYWARQDAMEEMSLFLIFASIIGLGFFGLYIYRFVFKNGAEGKPKD